MCRDDPYGATDVFTTKLGWTLVFATPPESGDPLAAVALGDGQVLLGVTDERFLKPAARGTPWGRGSRSA